MVCLVCKQGGLRRVAFVGQGKRLFAWLWLASKQACLCPERARWNKVVYTTQYTQIEKHNLIFNWLVNCALKKYLKKIAACKVSNFKHNDGWFNKLHKK
jgi:trans-aconitate methyltransferase